MLSRLFPKTLICSRLPSTTTSAISFLRRLRPLSGAVIASPSFRSLSFHVTHPFHDAPTTNCSVLKSRNGCDYKPFEVTLQSPYIDPSRDEPTSDELIHSYIKTLAEIVGSEDEARMMVFSLIITPSYYIFGTLLSEELYGRVEALPGFAIDPSPPFVNVINGKPTNSS